MHNHPKHIVIDARIRQSSTGRYTDRLIDRLQRIDQLDTYTVLVSKNDPWKPSSTNFKRKICDIPQFSFNLLNDIRFAGLLKSLKPDLVHFTMTQQPIIFLGRAVTTTHDLTMFRFARAGKTSLPIFWVKMVGYRFMFWWSHHKSRRIIVPTNYVKDELSMLEPFTSKKISVTHEASEPRNMYKPKSPKFFNTKKPFLLYVGTAFPHKNLDRLIKAFVKIKLKYPNIQLVLVGKKEYYYDLIDNLIKENSYEEIYTPGFVSDNELAWLYEHCAAYIFPSLSEGFGLPGLEAMTNGAPVICSNSSCLPEVYGSAALYFDPTNIDDMVNKIDLLMSDKSLRNKLVSLGEKQVSKYSWEKMAEQTLDIYRDALDQSR